MLQGEVDGDEGTFTGILHEDDRFAQDLFERFLIAAERLAKDTGGVPRRDAVELFALVIDRMEYMLLRFVHHLDARDISTIKNFDDIDVPHCGERIRKVSLTLVTALTEM